MNWHVDKRSDTRWYGEVWFMDDGSMETVYGYSEDSEPPSPWLMAPSGVKVLQSKIRRVDQDA